MPRPLCVVISPLAGAAAKVLRQAQRANFGRSQACKESARP
jgi:hypothetical protein